jgi:amino acid permease
MGSFHFLCSIKCVRGILTRKSNASQTITDPQGNRTYTFTGGTGRLVGMWSAMNTIFFSLQGFFTVSVTAAENKHVDRDETIKLASRKIALRVILLYTLIVFTVGLNVPYNDINLQDQTISSIRRGQNSPVVISCVRNGVTGWPHFFNAFYIFSAFSTGINGLYISSRLLHALASIRNVWPATGWGNSIKMRLEQTNSKGVPVNAVLVSWVFAFLGFLAVKPQPEKVYFHSSFNDWKLCSPILTAPWTFGHLLNLLHAHSLHLHIRIISLLQTSYRKRRLRRRSPHHHSRRHISKPQRIRLSIQIPRTMGSCRLCNRRLCPPSYL